MNINHLAIFHAVALEGSVSRGAERLHISQPAVSKQLRELERSLGTALFHRLSKGVQLTEAGELLLAYSRQIFALETEAEQALAELRGLQRGQLKVGASTTVGAVFLPMVLARFRDLYPAIELKLEIANSLAIQRQLLENRLDLAIVGGPVEEAGLTAEMLFEDEMVLIVANTHPWAGTTIAPERLGEQPLLLREAGSGSRASTQAALAMAGIALRSMMTLGSNEAIKRAVAGGIGMAFLSERIVTEEIAAGKLAIVRVEGLTTRCPVSRLRRAGHYEGRAAREFMRLLRLQRPWESLAAVA